MKSIKARSVPVLLTIISIAITLIVGVFYTAFILVGIVALGVGGLVSKSAFSPARLPMKKTITCAMVFTGLIVMAAHTPDILSDALIFPACFFSVLCLPIGVMEIWNQKTL